MFYRSPDSQGQIAAPAQEMLVKMVGVPIHIHIYIFTLKSYILTIIIYILLKNRIDFSVICKTPLYVYVYIYLQMFTRKMCILL